MSKLQTREVTWQEHDDAGRPVTRSFDVRYEWVDGEAIIDGIWTNEDIFDLLTCPATPKLLLDTIKREIEDYEEAFAERLEWEDFDNRRVDLLYDRRKDKV